MSPWSHLFLEGYCCYEWMKKKQWKGYELDPEGENLIKKKPVIIMKNKDYVHWSKRPIWCRVSNLKKVPCMGCLADGDSKKCPFFAFTEADDKDKRMFEKAWSKKYG